MIAQKDSEMQELTILKKTLKIIREIPKNSGKIYKTFYQIIKKKSSVAFDLHDSENNISIDNKDTADFINDFFVIIGPKLAAKNDEVWNYNGYRTDITLNDIQTDRDEIIQLCNDININKASCIENLSAEILRDAFLAVPEKNVELFNCSFMTSTVPVCWKVAKVTPL